MQNQQIQQSLDEILNVTKKILQKTQALETFQYANFMRENVERFISDFHIKSIQSAQDHTNEPYRLHILFRTEQKSEFQNCLPPTQSKSIKVLLSPPNIFVYTFQLPCNFKTYQNMIKSDVIQKKVDEMITEYKVLKQIAENQCLQIQLVYLSYKRVLIIAPREFIYVRIIFRDQSDKVGRNVYWIVTFSVPFEAKTDKTRADIIFTVQKIEQNTIENKISVKVLSEIDMKTSAKADITRNKGCTQLKKYIQKLYDHCKLEKIL